MPDKTDSSPRRHSPRGLLIDRQLPRSDASSFSAVLAGAGREAAFSALASVQPDEVWHSVPVARLAGQLRGKYVDAVLPVAERQGSELVVGMLGRMMTRTQLEFRRFEPREFARFDEPGYGKVAVGFLVLRYGPSHSVLCAETRAVATDPVTARQFRRYWKAAGAATGYLVRHWLELAQQRAEQG
jgi:hypothetical protein